MAESQMRHRQSLESAVVLGNVRAQNHGQVMAFILGLITILGGIGLIAFDKDVEGLAAIITAFVGLGGLFIYGRIEQSRERQRKRDEVRQAAENPRLPFESN